MAGSVLANGIVAQVSFELLIDAQLFDFLQHTAFEAIESCIDPAEFQELLLEPAGRAKRGDGDIQSGAFGVLKGL